MIRFCNFVKKRNMEITTLADEYLLMVDPYCEGFFDKVLGYVSQNEDIKAFVEAVREVKQAELSPFWRPALDPSQDGESVIFKKEQEPFVGHSFNWWKAKAEEIPAVEGKNWEVGTDYQYYAFLVYLINQLVERRGWKISKALEAVVLDSKELGHYRNSKNALHDFEMTGSRGICGCYDLANTCKILRCTNEEIGGFWLAGGDYNNGSIDFSLSCLVHYRNVVYDDYSSVGWLVLK